MKRPVATCVVSLTLAAVLTPLAVAQGGAEDRALTPGAGGGVGAGASGLSGGGMGPMGGQMPTFTSFDADQDGLLTEQEFAQGRAERIAQRSQQGFQMRNLGNAPTFEDIDQNSDGAVDPQEFADAQMQHRRSN